MKLKIKTYFESLNPKVLGLKRVKVSSVKKLGMGKSNLNYLVDAGKKFVIRFNIDKKNKGKTKREYLALNAVERLNIAPKVRVLDTSKKHFDMDFLILDYLEGKSLEGKKLSNSLIKNLARMSARMHQIDVRVLKNILPHEECCYSSYLKVLRGYIKYIKKNIKDNKFIRMLDETYYKLERGLPHQERVKLVLTHGDICRQNVIFNKGEYKLIDFEDLGLTDPAAEIAHIFVDFGTPFSEKQKEIFLDEYEKLTGNYLSNRVETYIPLKFFAVFLWACSHVIKVRMGEMHEHYLKDKELMKDVEYAELVFRRALGSGVIDRKYSAINLGIIL